MHVRDVAATTAIATGPALELALADYRVTERLHQKPIAARDVDYPRLRIPALASYPKWFMVSDTDSSIGDYLSVFQQERAGDPWLLTLNVWQGAILTPYPIPLAGGAEPADATSLAQGQAAIQAFARYLQTGRPSAPLSDVTQARSMRKGLASAAKRSPGATTTMRCSVPRGSPVYAVQTMSGSHLASSLACVITVKSHAGWVQHLFGRWKGLVAKSTGLTYVQVHEVVEFSMILSTTGRATVTGTNWNASQVIAR